MVAKVSMSTLQAVHGRQSPSSSIVSTKQACYESDKFWSHLMPESQRDFSRENFTEKKSTGAAVAYYGINTEARLACWQMLRSTKTVASSSNSKHRWMTLCPPIVLSTISVSNGLQRSRVSRFSPAKWRHRYSTLYFRVSTTMSTAHVYNTCAYVSDSNTRSHLHHARSSTDNSHIRIIGSRPDKRGPEDERITNTRCRFKQTQS